MRMLYGLEFVFMVRELEDCTGLFVENFYELGKNRFRIKLSKSGIQANLLCFIPYSISKVSEVERVETPTNFAIAARKRLKGFKIEKIEQLNNDRIVRMHLTKGDEKAYIIVELFGKGNLILANGSGTITLAYMQHEFKDRSIRIGSAYAPPKSNLVNIENMEDVKKAIMDAQEGNASVYECVQKAIQIGKPYAKKILKEIGIEEGAKCDALNGQMVGRFAEALARYLSGEMGFYIYRKNGSMVDFSIGRLDYNDLEAERVGSLGEALSLAYLSQGENAGRSSVQIEIEKSIEKQKAIIEEAEKGMAESRRIADFIFENMHEINSIIEKARSEKHITKDELQKLAKSIKIKDVDLKNKTITIEI
ncbi:MAG: NFACT family protein [Candidatus Micrarchaeia archaeon]